MSLRDRVLQILESEAKGGVIPEGFGDTYKRKYKKPAQMSEWQKCQKLHGKNAKDYYSKEDKKCHKKKATAEYRKCYAKHGENTPKYYSETKDKCLKNRKRDYLGYSISDIPEGYGEEPEIPKMRPQPIKPQTRKAPAKPKAKKPLSQWQECQKKYKKQAKDYYSREDKKCYDTTNEYRRATRLLPEERAVAETLMNSDLPLAVQQALQNEVNETMQNSGEAQRDLMLRTLQENTMDDEDNFLPPRRLDNEEYLDLPFPINELPEEDNTPYMNKDLMKQIDEGNEEFEKIALMNIFDNQPEETKQEVKEIINEIVQIAEDPQADKTEIADKIQEIADVIPEIKQELTPTELKNSIASAIEDDSYYFDLFGDITGDGLYGGCAGCGGMCGGAMLGGAKLKKKKSGWAKCVKKYGVRGAKPHYSKTTKRCYKVVKEDRNAYRKAKKSPTGKKLSPYMIFQKQMKGVKMTKDERATAYEKWKIKYGY